MAQENKPPLTPPGEAIKLLRDLADLQNGPPLERYRKDWEETMCEVYGFLRKWEVNIIYSKQINEFDSEEELLP